MKTYELTYIISPEITLEEAQAKGKEIESAVASKEGVILRQSNPVAKTLSHPVGKSASGFLGILEFQAEPEKFIELQEIIQKDGKIVRHMVIIKKPARIRTLRARKHAENRIEPVAVKEVSEVEGPAPEAVVKTTEEQKRPSPKAKVELKDIEQELDEILS